MGYVDESLLGLSISRSRELRPTSIAIEGTNGELVTYAQLEANVEQFAGGLQRSGIGNGDVLAVQAPNSASLVKLMYACWRVGAVFCPIVTIYKEHELRATLESLQPTAVVSVYEHRAVRHSEMLDDVLRELQIKPRLKLLLSGNDNGWKSVDQFGSSPSGNFNVSPDDPCLVLPTSGSTSGPKLVVHSSRTLTASAKQLIAMRWNSQDASYVCIPIPHINGITRVTLPLSIGARIVIRDRWDTSRWVEDVVNGKFSHSSVPALLLNEVMEAYEATGCRPTAMRTLNTFLSSSTKDAFERAEAHGFHPDRGYGMTECATAATHTIESSFEVRVHDDGWPLAGVEIDAIDEEGKHLSPGIEGELVLRGPQQMLGYLDPVVNEEVWTEEGFILTGDLGTVDEIGGISITGRKKEIINRGGEKFSCRELEEAIITHPNIREVAVVPAPHPRLGEVPAAFIVLRDGSASPPSNADLAEHVREHGLALQKIPEIWTILAELPKTENGKLAKGPLIAALVEGKP